MFSDYCAGHTGHSGALTLTEYACLPLCNNVLETEKSLLNIMFKYQALLCLLVVRFLSTFCSMQYMLR